MPVCLEQFLFSSRTLQSTPLVLLQTLSSSITALIPAVATIADDESNMARDGQRTEATRRRRHRHRDVTLFVSPPKGYNTTTFLCFAGKEDELLVSTEENQLLIWELPSSGGRGHREQSTLLFLNSRHTKT